MSTSQGLRPASWIAIIGGVLIVTAIIALVGASWDQLSPLARSIIVGVPVLGLYAAGYLTQHKEAQREVGVISILTANVAFPFALGTVLYQLSGLTSIDASFVAIVSGAAAIWYITQEFLFELRQNSLITAVGTLVWLASLMQALGTSPIVNSAIYLSASTLACLTAIALVRKDQKIGYQPKVYLLFGLIAYIWSAIVFAIDTNELSNLSLHTWYGQLVFVGTGVVSLAIAVYAAQRYQKTHHPLLLALRLLFERFGCGLALIGSIITVGTLIGDLSSITSLSSELIILTSIVLGIAGLTLSWSAPIRRLRLLSAALLAWTVCVFLARVVDIANLSLPIIMLALGIVLIITSFSLTSSGKAKEWIQKFQSLPTSNLWGLGDHPDDPQHESLFDSLTTFDQNRPSKDIFTDQHLLVSEVRKADGSTVRFMREQPGTGTSILRMLIVFIMLFLFIVEVVVPFFSN